MAKSVRVGMVGAGMAAGFHLSSYRRVSGIAVELAGIASRTEAKARALADRHGIERVLPDWRSLLDRPDGGCGGPVRPRSPPPPHGPGGRSGGKARGVREAPPGLRRPGPHGGRAPLGDVRRGAGRAGGAAGGLPSVRPEAALRGELGVCPGLPPNGGAGPGQWGHHPGDTGQRVPQRLRQRVLQALGDLRGRRPVAAGDPPHQRRHLPEAAGRPRQGAAPGESRRYGPRRRT